MASASNMLTAKVRIDSSQAERKLRAIAKSIDAINRNARKSSSAFKQVQQALSRSARSATKVHTSMKGLVGASKQVGRAMAHNNDLLTLAASKVRRLASIYLGVMGMKALIGASDQMTSAQNRINQVNAANFGASGYQDSGYSSKTLDKTQQDMDKIFAASQRARTGYQDMIGNVSKSMVLANDAFGGSMDNAIAFQQTMAKAYTVGGASAAEQASSMYQMIQALGSGVLQGDQLRSVRQGAPLAAQAIQEFAQQVYGTTDSLKDMASQGKISAQLVVAAIAAADDQISKSFDASAMTFAQAWIQIKNVALQSIRPIQQYLNEVLNSQTGKKLLTGIQNAVMVAAKALEMFLHLVVGVIQIVANNWNWLQYLVYAGIAMLVAFIMVSQAKVIMMIGRTVAAFIMTNPALVAIIAVIGLVTAAVIRFGQTSESVTQFISRLATFLGRIILGVFIAIAVAALATGAAIMPIPVIIAGLIIGVLALILGIFFDDLGEMMGGLFGFGNAVVAVFKNIGIAVQKFIGMAVSHVLQDIRTVIGAINTVGNFLGFGTIDTSGLDNTIAKFNAMQDKQFINVGDEFNKGRKKGTEKGQQIQQKLNQMNSTLDSFKDPSSKLPTGGTLPTGITNPTMSDLIDTNEKTADNTKDIADAVKMTSRDLAYLRKVAELQWKKQFTTNQIKLEVVNNNSVSSESDLDGIVEGIGDKLLFELHEIAAGVHS